MKRLIFLFALMLTVAALSWATEMDGSKGRLTTRDTLTVTSQFTAYGSWNRACSTVQVNQTTDSDTLFIFTDSGVSVVELTGDVLLAPGQKLYIGLDKMAGATMDSSDSDTGLGYTWVMNPADPGRGQPARFPFRLRSSQAADSGVAILAPVATFATGGSTYNLSVTNIMLKWEMLTILGN